MRVYLCYVFVLFFSLYAHRRWFVSLCAAIAMMAVLEHPDMPKSIGGVQGLNPWNILMLNVLIGWMTDKSRENRQLDCPPVAKRCLLLFAGLMLFSTIRLLMNPGVLAIEETTGSMISEYVVNTYKWLIPGILVFDGARDPKNARLAMVSILALYTLLAIQVIRWMPLGMIAASGDALSYRASKITRNEIGYNRVTLSMMLAGASWAMFSTLVLVKTWRNRLLICAAAFSIVFGQALTGGRTGYATWLVLGFILAAIRWRKLLIYVPIFVIVILSCVPAVRERMLQGIVDTGDGTVDEYEMTSGRNIAWPYVVEGIKKSPLIGHGRQAMVTSGIRDRLWDEFEESFPHPHNAYLEMLLDGGAIGLTIQLALFITLVRYSYTLLRNADNPMASAVGGMCFSLLVALMLGSFGGQTFYPREGSVGLWATVGLMLRMLVQVRTPAPEIAEETETEIEVEAEEQRDSSAPAVN